ncbi:MULTISPECIES: septum formation initiator family protein [Enterococcus]|uniref:FtsB family cell division protein n=1 Tax=Enterococcus sp. AZ103 TaxID=2774628 RepID=UPI003F23A0FB
MAEEKKKLATISNPYAKKQFQKFQKEHRQLIFKRRRLAVFFAVAAVIFIVMGVQIFSERQKLSELQDIKVTTQAESVKLDDKVETLQQEVALLKNDDYVAKLARSRYYYSKDGELIFVLPEESTDSSSNSSAK